MGVETDAWTLRELCYAVEAKHRQQWDDWSIGIALLINHMPRFARGFRGISPAQINPYRRAQRGIPLVGDAAERALDSMSVKEDTLDGS